MSFFNFFSKCKEKQVVVYPTGIRHEVACSRRGEHNCHWDATGNVVWYTGDGPKMIEGRKGKSVSFIGIESGDCECFCWREVRQEDKIAIVGSENYETDRKLEEEFRKDQARDLGRPFDSKDVEKAMEMLYPGDVMIALGVKPDKKYRFTVTAEEV